MRFKIYKKINIECEFFKVISIDSLVVYEKSCYLQLYLNNCAYKVVDKWMIDCLDNNSFETDED